MTKTLASATASSSSNAKEDVSKAQTDNGSCKDSMTIGSKDTPKSSDCPLFMDGLPSDFAANPGLAAIAALLDEDEGGKDSKKDSPESMIEFKSGGGKVKKKSKSKNHSPYNKQQNKMSDKDQKKASLGEAQLFMNMWKI
mmetsp:Transcript_27828/g.47306  ORF Transcript_27828/g.47306 Transcript_27828/m.47306 type:complete len:140 (-) Transcript_27828:179-598(-)